MKKIMTIGGSNSKSSINKKLAEYVASQVNNVTIQNIDLNNYNIPIYSIDIEQSVGIPNDIIKLNDNFDNVDGFVISLAEHNGSYTAAFKNIFDWLSRANKEVWRNKPMLLLATSPGARGGATVLETAKTSFPHLGGNIIGSISFPSFYDNFKEDKIVNEELNTDIFKMIALFKSEIKK